MYTYLYQDIKLYTLSVCVCVCVCVYNFYFYLFKLLKNNLFLIKPQSWRDKYLLP